MTTGQQSRIGQVKVKVLLVDIAGQGEESAPGAEHHFTQLIIVTLLGKLSHWEFSKLAAQ